MAEKKKWNKTFVTGANGKAMYFDNGGYIIDVIIPKDSLGELEEVTAKGSGKKFLKFKISPYRNGEDKFGNTHSIFVSKMEDDSSSGDNDEFNKKMGPTDEMPF